MCFLSTNNSTPYLSIMHISKFIVYTTLAVAISFPTSGFSQNSSETVRLSAEKEEKLLQIESHLKNKSEKKLTKSFREGNKYERVIIKVKSTTPQKTMLQSKANRKALHMANQQKISKVEARFTNKNFTIKNKSPFFNIFSAEITIDGLTQLVADDDVVAIYKDRVKKPMLRDGIALMEGSQARALNGGAGVAVAIIDTGIDYTHPDLGNDAFPNSKVIGGYDTGEYDNDPMDVDGHGTSVAGIVAGNIPSGSVGDYIGGVAPDAKLYALKVTTSYGAAYDSAILAAVDWSILHKDDDPDNPIKIINISYGGGEFTGNCDNDSYERMYTEPAELAYLADITVFASSGNEGFEKAMCSPACLSKVVSVGEVYDSNLGASGPWSIDGGYCTDSQTYGDLVTCYSNSSSTLDFLAPGSDAHVTDISGNEGYSIGNYDYFGGTSAASPYAAGAAALIQSVSLAHRDQYYSVDELVNVLKKTGEMVTDPRNNRVTPRINISQAAQVSQLFGDINGDKIITLTDTILALQIVSGETPAGPITAVGDCDNNGKIGIAEALFSMKIIALLQD